MNPRERILRTFQRLGTDKVPKGELGEVNAVLAARLLEMKGLRCDDPFEARKAVHRMLHFDLVDAGLGAPPRDRIGEDDNGNPILSDIRGTKVVVPKDSGAFGGRAG